MSAGRRYRRAAEQARTAAVLVEARTAEPRFHGTAGPYELWMRGAVLFAIPKLPEDAPAEIIDAIERRRRASLEGRCDCGARQRFHRVDGEVRHFFEHEDECAASDAGLLALAERWGWPA